MSVDVIRNAMSVDLEDYFQVSAFESCVDRQQWDEFPCRVERNTNRILELFDAAETKATFFTLGWIAKRYPLLIRDIVARGHELASHGFAHIRASSQQPSEFLKDVSDTKHLLEDISGGEVTGYRAASFSIGSGNLWALDCLSEAGYKYSSSIYPINHDHYGMPDSPRFPYRHNGIVEVPISTLRLFNRNLPCGGGGYFRLLPYQVFKWALSRLHRQDARSALFYFHPWEIDPDQPRVSGVSKRNHFRHYVNLDKMERRLTRLLADFDWGRMDDVFGAEIANC